MPVRLFSYAVCGKATRPIGLLCWGGSRGSAIFTAAVLSIVAVALGSSMQMSQDDQDEYRV